MESKIVYTQEELDKAIEESFYPILMGDGSFEVSGSAQVRAYDYAQVTAYDSAQVWAYDYAQVTAYDSAQVRATGYAQVRASGSAQVTATKFVAVTISPTHSGKITGGVQIKIPPVKTAIEWIEFYGVTVKKNVAILYKAVDDDFSTDNARAKNIYYKPGAKPEAPDWDGGIEECGGGLHFCPTPVHALDYNRTAKHFVACPVNVSDIVVHFPAAYPDKVKSPRVCAPCYEVNIHGEKI